MLKQADGSQVDTAVKLARVKASAADKADFLAEAELMLSLNHPTMLKVITLIQSFLNHQVYGLSISRKPWLLVTEFMLYKDICLFD